jgi:hypothetical protein
MSIISVTPAGAGLVGLPGTPGYASLAWGYFLIAAPRLTFHYFRVTEGAGWEKPNGARSLTLTALWAVVIVQFSCAWVRHRRMGDCSENKRSCGQLWIGPSALSSLAASVPGALTQADMERAYGAFFLFSWGVRT